MVGVTPRSVTVCNLKSLKLSQSGLTNQMNYFLLSVRVVDGNVLYKFRRNKMFTY